MLQGRGKIYHRSKNKRQKEIDMENHSMGLCTLCIAYCRPRRTPGRKAKTPHDLPVALCTEELIRSYSENIAVLKSVKTFLGCNPSRMSRILAPYTVPKAVLLEQSLQQVSEDSAVQETTRELLLTCEERGITVAGSGALRRRHQRQHPESSAISKGPRFDPRSCGACQKQVASYSFFI